MVHTKVGEIFYSMHDCYFEILAKLDYTERLVEIDT